MPPNLLLLDLLNYLSSTEILKNLELEQSENLFLLGMGKAAPALCVALKKKYKFNESLVLGNDIGGHPYMNQGSLLNGQRLSEFVKRIPKEAHLVVALTGGASAMVDIIHPYFKNLTSEYFEIQKEIVLAGISIEQMNKMRKSLSQLKNGGLFKFSGTQSIETIVISDTPEKNLSDVGSGPTVYSQLNLEELREIGKIVLDEKLCKLYFDYLNLHEKELVRDVRHHTFKVIADYSIACKKMKEYQWHKNLNILLDPLSLSLNEGVEFLISKSRGSWVFSGGEFTVKVKSREHGQGGRNQHLVLEFARRIFFLNELELNEKQLKQCYIVSIGSDGIDGNTEVAGAYFDFSRLQKAKELGLEPESFLELFDSHTFLQKVEALIKTAATDTNIMDLRLSFIPN
jgi:glycerate 2-kinase